jgi:osmotically-inducible protein OsmY
MLCKLSSYVIALILMTLSFSYAYGSATDDHTITLSVKELLKAEKDIPAKDIKVTTADRVVSLSGTVDTKLQAHKAVELASSVDNVVDVVDANLKVRDSSSSLIVDSLITAKVKGKIRHLKLYNKISGNYDLHVETVGHVVHIFGEVGRAIDIDTIKEAVRKVDNVESVKTNIKVRS